MVFDTISHQMDDHLFSIFLKKSHFTDFGDVKPHKKLIEFKKVPKHVTDVLTPGSPEKIKACAAQHEQGLECDVKEKVTPATIKSKLNLVEEAIRGAVNVPPPPAPGKVSRILHDGSSLPDHSEVEVKKMIKEHENTKRERIHLELPTTGSFKKIPERHFRRPPRALKVDDEEPDDEPEETETQYVTRINEEIQTVNHQMDSNLHTLNHEFTDLTDVAKISQKIMKKELNRDNPDSLASMCETMKIKLDDYTRQVASCEKAEQMKNSLLSNCSKENAAGGNCETRIGPGEQIVGCVKGSKQHPRQYEKVPCTTETPLECKYIVDTIFTKLQIPKMFAQNGPCYIGKDAAFNQPPVSKFEVKKAEDVVKSGFIGAPIANLAVVIVAGLSPPVKRESDNFL